MSNSVLMIRRNVLGSYRWFATSHFEVVMLTPPGGDYICVPPAVHFAAVVAHGFCHRQTCFCVLLLVKLGCILGSRPLTVTFGVDHLRQTHDTLMGATPLFSLPIVPNPQYFEKKIYWTKKSHLLESHLS